ncbi:MAG: PAS domain-containing protein [Ignavibacteriae bacterium]|nr:PAS domain-containing protein [Ignavibacteriota bacterium]
MYSFRNGPAGKRPAPHGSTSGSSGQSIPPVHTFNDEELRQLLPGCEGDEIILITETGRIAYMNDTLREHLGHAVDDVPGLVVMDVDPSMTRAAWLSTFSAMKRVRHAVKAETDHMTSDGRRIRKEYTSACVTLKGKTYFLAIGAAVETTEADGETQEEREEREATMAAMREQTILGAVSDGVMIVDARGLITEINSSAENTLGVYRNEVLGQPCTDQRLRLTDLRGNVLRVSHHPVMRALVEEAPVPSSRCALLQSDGSMRLIDISAWPLYDTLQQIVGAIAILRPMDVSGGHDMMHEPTGLVGAVARVARGIVHATSLEQTERLVCDALVDAGYPLVWFGRLKPNDQRIHPSAWAGSGAEFLLKIKARYDNSEHGNTPIGRCIREGAEQIVFDTQDGDTFHPWKKQAEQENLLSMMSLPLIYDGRVDGLLGVFSEERGRFREGEAAQLRSLATFVSFAESGIRDRLRRLELAKHIAVQRPLLDAVLDSASAAVCLMDPGQPFRIRMANRAFQQMLDQPFRTTGVKDTFASELIYAHPQTGFYERVLDCAATQAPVAETAAPFRNWSGEVSYWDWSITPLIENGELLGLLYRTSPSAELPAVIDHAAADAVATRAAPQAAAPTAVPTEVEADVAPAPKKRRTKGGDTPAVPAKKKKKEATAAIELPAPPARARREKKTTMLLDLGRLTALEPAAAQLLGIPRDAVQQLLPVGDLFADDDAMLEGLADAVAGKADRHEFVTPAASVVVLVDRGNPAVLVLSLVCSAR